MSLDEKIGQLNQVPNEPQPSPSSLVAGEIGSIILAATAHAGNDRPKPIDVAQLNAWQQASVRESRLGIPMLFARDVIHGHKTVAPIPLGQAASWRPELVEACATVAAAEAAADGINWVFTPMLDIARDPRWGRVAEGFGEDPFLASRLAAAAVRGYQGADLNSSGRVAACAKHFAGYGAAEGGRDYNTAEISENTLWNVYLPPFKAAVAAGVASVMSCFNEIGGLPATANEALLRGILKCELGFQGPIVSDWNAVAELLDHGLAVALDDAACMALRAGVDIDMISGAYSQSLRDLLEEGRVSGELLNDAVHRVLSLKARLGLFESPFADPSQAAKVHLAPEHRKSTLELARASLVLLKNASQLLPLTKECRRIGLFGPLIDARDSLNGSWCLDGDPNETRTIRACLEELLTSGQGLVATSDPSESLILAGKCDVAVVVVGEDWNRSGEARSVTSLELPDGQIEWLERLASVGTPIAAVVLAGRPLALTRLSKLAEAIVYAWHPGTMGGQAVAETLVGAANPCGRLPITFPRSVGQIPLYYNCKATGRPLDPYAQAEGRYIDERDSPLYPFGYGFGYLPVEYRDLEIRADKDGATIGCTIESRGPAAEVAQLYLRDRVASRTRPAKELKGFQAVQVNGQARVSFRLEREDLGFYGADHKWLVEPGWFDVWIGPNSVSGLRGEFELP